MVLRCGLVGLPNVGKSTLFNALTCSQIPAANYPFCTIDPHFAQVPVHDPRMEILQKIVQSQKLVPAYLEIVDIAGLVQGAAQGAGLGNQFLSHVRNTQAIVHVVRCFEHKDVLHVLDRVDPVADALIIETELLLSDLAWVHNQLAKKQKLLKSASKEMQIEYQQLEALAAHLNKGLPARTFQEPCEALSHLITAKPMLYVANIQDIEADQKRYERLQAYAAEQNLLTLKLCAQLEAEIVLLPPEEQTLFLETLGEAHSGLQRLAQKAYELLGLVTYFTAGPQEIHAWTLKGQCSAVEAAGVIHSDFAKGFIRAEVMAFEDFVKYQGEQGVKEAGKWRLEGRDYIVQEGDILHFRFNV